MERIARFGERLIQDALDPAREIDFVRVQRTTAPSSGMGRRVYTGMVPDFGGESDVEGMLVSDVRPDGPAARAGVIGGDVVVEFAGISIGSLQDYSDALRGAKIGQAVPIVVIRNGERISLTITPEARQQ
jgi:S1-C subfamily serine protease